MQAIVLAAGLGRRLADVSGGRPKCLQEVGGRALIEHQLRALAGLDVDSVCVVLGHAAQQIRTRLAGWPRCRFVINERFAETNSLYSLWLARRHVRGSFLVLNSDVLAHPDIYRRVAELDGTGLAFDSTSGADDEHMKVSMRGQRLTAIAKQLPSRSVSGENLGILRIGGGVAGRFFDEAEGILRTQGESAWAPAVLDRMAGSVTIEGVDVADLPWTEIDFPEDLDHARREVWPRLARRPRLPRTPLLTRIAPRFPAGAAHGAVLRWKEWTL